MRQRYVLPQSVLIDQVNHRVVIDGVTLPWYMAEAPTVEQQPVHDWVYLADYIYKGAR